MTNPILPVDANGNTIDALCVLETHQIDATTTPKNVFTANKTPRIINVFSESNGLSVGWGVDDQTDRWMPIPSDQFQRLLIPANTNFFVKSNSPISATVLLMGGLEGGKAPTVVPQVTGLGAVAGDGQIILSWQAVDGVGDYEIFSGTGANNMTVLSDGVSDITNYVHVGLTNGETRYYKVRAVASDGTLGTFSGVVYATPVEESVTPADTTPPTMVVTVSSDPVVDTTATITFTASEPIVGFTLSDIYLDSYAIGSQAGTLDNFQGSGAVYTARYTAPTDTQTDIEVGVGVNQFTDLAGNTHEGVAFVKFYVESTPIEAKKVAFLLGGQSNMVGRAEYDGGATYPSTVQQWKQSKVLAPAVSPLDHLDERGGDMGLALQFSIDYMEANPTHELVLIPAAKGGSAIQGDNNWGVGDNYYNNAIDQANTFFDENPDYVLGGILWHQGESDAGNPDPYQELFDAQIHGFRNDITVASEKTPFICGELAPAWIGTNQEGPRVILNNIIKTVSQRIAYTHCISSENLHTPVSAGTGTDYIHFDAPSLRLMGSRYYTALAEAKAKSAPVPPPTVVEQVTGLIATAGDGEVTLTWDAVSNASDYIILTGLNTSSMAALNDGVTPNTTYNHTSLTNGEERFYSVRAKASDDTLGEPSAIVSATPAVPENIPAGYILRTNFDTGSPVDVTGSSNLSLHRSAVISDDPIRGKVFNSPDIPAGASGYIDTARGGVIGSNSFTLSAWVNMPSFGGKFALFGSVDKVDARIVLFIGFDHLTLMVNAPYDREGGVGRKEMPIEYLNTWIMVSATYNRDTGDVKLYINGAEFSSGVGNPAGDFTVGLDVFGFRSLADHDFVGLGDDAIIWDKELSPSEIADLYNEQNTE